MKREQIDRIMDEFDFKKVHKFMIATNWQWSRENVMLVPSIPELRKCARSLLTQFSDKSLSLSCGGFVVRHCGHGQYVLTFEIASQSSYSEEM